ncbi:histidine decarboxylase [Tabrizicola sp.]|uniref:histidine decarboxylase n=1 Tax=Tabrizicola sp. TaxID=2005166 RepID=UPI00286CD719|nr:histidine decarboxylase [Tabrizicola sp.]
MNDELMGRLVQTEQRMRAAHQTHLGYPYNLSFGPGVPATLQQFLINNLGDPYVGSHYASEVCELEREAVSWLMRLWGCVNLDDYWGTIGASGTEGNIWGIYLGREALPDAVLLYSADAHYSIPKAARIQRIDAVEVPSNPAGEIDLAALATAVAGLNGRPVILALTCGTTMKGAHDDIAGALVVLEATGLGRDRRYVHVDGALNAMVIPFLQGAPDRIRPSFEMGIDSISTSGHKMIGTPMPCGALVARRIHVDRIARAVAYLKSNDTTLMGSRNGHAVLSIWARLFGHGYGGYAHDALGCSLKAEALADRLRASGRPVLCNPYALTVVFGEPGPEIVNRYQLAANKGLAHAIVMPNVTDDLLDRFATDYLNWSKWTAA